MRITDITISLLLLDCEDPEMMFFRICNSCQELGHFVGGYNILFRIE
jgi:hypothetical protein